MQKQIERLKSLGLTSAAERLAYKVKLNQKLHKAYQKYSFIRPEAIDSFNDELRKKTEHTTGTEGFNLSRHFDELVFKPLASYTETPPEDVLGKLEEAIADNCFDTFEIAKIESVVKYEDPILFGTINGCGDKFFIAQWDDDVKFEDLQKHMKDEI